MHAVPARRSKSVVRLLAPLAVLGLVAAACGGDGGDGGSEEAEGERGARETSTTVDEGTPTPGGKIVYGLEADTSTPWTPQKVVCAVSCHQVLKSVYDPLTLPDEEGNARPNLAESIEPNADFTEWTIRPRPGITFHDGTPFDAEAIRYNLQDHLDSSLTKIAFKSIENIAVSPDGASTVVTMNTGWSDFPIFLSGQLGYIASPTWLQATKADPPTARETEPVGTGPFVFQEYEVGDPYAGTKNPDYWKTDAAGVQLPYVDSIEYRFIPDAGARINGLESGELNVAHTSSGQMTKRLRDSDKVESVETDEFGETNYIMLNNEDGPDAKSNPAMQDIRIRRAMAAALDREQLIEGQGAGVGQPANGPFTPGTMGYLEDTGYPEYDPEEAKRLVDEYEAEKGPVTIAYSTTNTPENLENAQILQGYWRAAGMDTDIRQIEQGSFILNAAFGDFQAFGWRNHGGFDPDQQNVWWHSDSAAPTGQIALNFGRFRDPTIDAALDTIRTSSDEAERTEAAETINRTFGEQAYNLWTSWTVWAFGFAPEVHGLTNATLPDGTPVAFPSNDKITNEVAQLWVEQ